MRAQARLIRHPLLAVTAALGALLCGCGPSEDEEPKPPPRDTPSYLSGAVNPKAIFHFVPKQGYPNIPVLIEVYDQGIPDHDARIADVVHARSVWKSGIASKGIVVDTYTRLMSQNSPYSSKDCPIQVRWVDTLPGAKLGTSYTVMASGNRVDRVEVTLARRDPNGKQLSAKLMRAVCLHELGHALGLTGFNFVGTGHSTSEADVMFPEAVWKWKSLSQGDTLTIGDLYHAAPHILPEGT